MKSMCKHNRVWIKHVDWRGTFFHVLNQCNVLQQILIGMFFKLFILGYNAGWYVYAFGTKSPNVTRCNIFFLTSLLYINLHPSSCISWFHLNSNVFNVLSYLYLSFTFIQNYHLKEINGIVRQGAPLYLVIFMRAWIKHLRVSSMYKRKGVVLPEWQKPEDANRNVAHMRVRGPLT
jgi:hypothetical protein